MRKNGILYHKKDRIDAERTEKRLTLEAKARQLRNELNSVEGELASGNFRPVRQEWIDNTAQFEVNLSSIANGAWTFVQETESQKRYEAPFKLLPASFKEAVLWVLQRSGIKSLTQGSYHRLSQSDRETLTDDQVNATLERIVGDADKIERLISKYDNENA